MSPPISSVRLFAQLNSHPYKGTEDCFRLAKKVVRFCKQEKRLPYPLTDQHTNAVFLPTNIGTQSLDAWQQAREYIEESIQEQEEDAVSVWLTAGSAAFDDACVALLSQYIIKSRRNDASFQLYKILSADDRTVVPLADKSEDRNGEIAAMVAPTLHLEGVGVAAPKRMQAMALAFIGNAIEQEPPKLLGQPGGNDYCLHRAAILPDAGIDFPHIRQFTDRLNDAAAFGAWIWGIYVDKNKGRQILYISDRRGEGGKSKLLNMLTRELFGERICSSFAANKLSGQNTHANSAFVGKKLVVVGDNKNSWLLHMPMFKELSGDDMSMVNAKYQQPYSTYFECRAIILSNFEPAITSEHHNRSRTLWLTLAPLLIPDTERDPLYGDKCKSELPGFLAWAQRCYAERCHNDYAIEVNAVVKKAIDRRIAQVETQYSTPFEHNFILDVDGTLTKKEWSAVVTTDLKLDANAAEDFRNWVLACHPDISEHCDPTSPTKWWLEGIRKKRGADNWRSRADTPTDKQTTDAALANLYKMEVAK